MREKIKRGKKGEKKRRRKRIRILTRSIASSETQSLAEISQYLLVSSSLFGSRRKRSKCTDLRAILSSTLSYLNVSQQILYLISDAACYVTYNKHCGEANEGKKRNLENTIHHTYFREGEVRGGREGRRGRLCNRYSVSLSGGRGEWGKRVG